MNVFDPATPKQIRAITKLCVILGINEPLEERQMSTVDAKDLQYRLLVETRLRRKRK